MSPRTRTGGRASRPGPPRRRSRRARRRRLPRSLDPSPGAPTCSAAGSGAGPSWNRTSRRKVVPWKTPARAERTRDGEVAPQQSADVARDTGVEGVGVRRREEVERALGAEVVLRDAPERGDGDRLLEELVEGVLSKVARGAVDRGGDGRDGTERLEGGYGVGEDGGGRVAKNVVSRPPEGGTGVRRAGRRRMRRRTAGPRGR